MTIDSHLLNSDNADVLTNVALGVFDNPIKADQPQAFLADPRHIMVVALDHETVVGMASAVEYFHPDKKPQLWINEVGVAATHRKQGIGRSLVQTLLNVAKERGCVLAWLGTDADNHAGQACFGSVANAGKPEPFLLYEWDLES